MSAGTTSKENPTACYGRAPGTTNTRIVDERHDEGKAFQDMAARAALGGCGLYRLADGELLLTRWGMARSCPDLRSVNALLSRMGVR